MLRKYSFLAAVVVVIVAGIVFLVGTQAKSEKVDDGDYNYVDTRIEKMMSNPEAMSFSNPFAYIQMSENEYLEIYELGEKVLPVLESIMSEEEAKGIHGLRYVLAGQIKEDIINQTNFFERMEQDQDESEKAAVADLVEDFGSKLQEVSLQAPKDILSKSIQKNYGNFVSPELLAAWQSNPSNAPGRAVSSPWPDRIEILSIEKLAEDEYEVNGEIIEMTSVELANGGVAARRPVTLLVGKLENRWLITAITLGAYEETNANEAS